MKLLTINLPKNLYVQSRSCRIFDMNNHSVFSPGEIFLTRPEYLIILPKSHQTSNTVSGIAQKFRNETIKNT